jgi:hypothetical protein
VTDPAGGGDTAAPRGLFARQKAWERPRRFIVWDRRGGATRTAQWSYRHPVLSAGIVVAAILAFGAALGLLGDQDGLRGSAQLWVLAGLVGWLAQGSLRATGQLYEEWSARTREATDAAGVSDPEASDGSAPSEGSTSLDVPATGERERTVGGGGLLGRMDRWNQRNLEEQAEVEAHGGPAYDSPVFRAYWAIWLGAKLGLPLVGLAVIALIDRLSG